MIHVAVPPNSVEIYNDTTEEVIKSSTYIEVRANSEIKLMCVAADSKPAADITWLKNNTRLFDVVQEDFPGGEPGLITRKSRVKYNSGNDNADIKCSVKHPALRRPIRSLVHLQIDGPTSKFIKKH